MTRIGLLQGATYMVLTAFTVACSQICTYLAVGYDFLGSRLWGSGQRRSAIMLLELFLMFGLLIAAVFTMIGVSAGKDKVITSVLNDVDISDDQGAEVVTTPVFILFCCVQPIRALTSVMEHAMVATNNQHVAAAGCVAGLVVFLCIAIPGMSSFLVVYIGEFCFWLIRFLVQSSRVVWLGYRPGIIGAFPAGIELNDTWKAIVQEKRRGWFGSILLFFVYLAWSLRETFSDPLTQRVFGGKIGSCNQSDSIGPTSARH